MLSQKVAVVEQVKVHLPNFELHKDIAIQLLTVSQLESIKGYITMGIINSVIEYGKDRTNINEVRLYSRSMVMNHLKKARELNGNQVYGTVNANKPAKESKALAGIDRSILTPELDAFVETLV